MGNQAPSPAASGVDPKVKDALDHVRTAAQQLHGAMSDAAAKRGGATKADLEVFAQKAKAVSDSAKASLGSQNRAAKTQLSAAIAALDASQAHAAEGLKSNGQALQTSFRKAIADARASVQKVSEAVAAKRSAATPQTA